MVKESCYNYKLTITGKSTNSSLSRFSPSILKIPALNFYLHFHIAIG